MRWRQQGAAETLLLLLLLSVVLTERQLVVDDDALRSRRVVAEFLQQTIGRLTPRAQLPPPTTPGEYSTHYSTSLAQRGNRR